MNSNNGLIDILDLNDPLSKNCSKTHEDLDLDELLSSFQRLSNNPIKEHQSLVDDCIILSMWTRSFVDFAYSSSKGASGGILSMWDSRVFTLENKILDRNFVAVSGSWTSIQANTTWIIFGDFNVVRHSGERASSTFDAREARIFNDFIARNGLFDFPLNCKRFTRFDSGGVKASKLDRFMMSHSFLNIWADALVSVLYRSYSDHCPIMLHVVSQNFGPKPYKVFDKWIGNEDFLALTTNSWASTSSTTIFPPNLTVKNKIKKFEEGLICDGDIIKREEWIMDLDQLDRMHREDLKQKCRIRWAIKGDKNSRFFHSLLKCKYVNTNIKGIHVNGIWQDDPDVIKNAGMDYFSSRFKEPLLSKPSFNSSLFKRLSNQEAHSLESNLSILKIKEAVWDCAGSKAPGSDGFNFNFIKA
ncbi:RNA-directed DNA polymerase, eukaryota [Tanacetum coccineum]